MKPTVHQYEDKLLELAYGELPAHEASAVEAHVQGCARCSTALSEIRSVRHSMARLPQVEAPEAGLDSLFAYAEQAARRNAAGPAAAPTFWRRLVAPLAGVAALGVVAVIGWRSQEDLGIPSPGKVAAEAQSERDLRTAPAPAVAQAAPPQAPEPVAAPDPVEAELAAGALAEQKQEAAPGGEKDALAARAKAKQDADRFDDSFDEAFGAGAKNEEARVQQRYGETRPPSDGKRDLGPSMETASKLSKTRRAEPLAEAEAQSADKAAREKAGERGGAEELLANDFSNAGLRGAGVKAKPPARPSAAAPPPPAAAPEAKSEPKPVAPQAVAAAPAPQQAAPAKKSGFGMFQGESSGRVAQTDFDDAPQAVTSGSGGAVQRKSVGVPPAPKGGVAAADSAPARSEATKEQRAASPKEIEQVLASARAARSREDRSQEISFAVRALDAGAAGSQRAEALQRVCEAFDALGREDQADRYCAALLAEFPGTRAAQQIAQRRNQPQLSPRPAARKVDKRAADEASAEKAAEPAKSAPAPAY